MSSQAPIRNNFECVTALCGGFYAIQQGAHTVSGFQKEVEVVVLQAGRSTMGKEHLLLRRYINVVKRKKEKKNGGNGSFSFVARSKRAKSSHPLVVLLVDSLLPTRLLM